MTGSRARAVAVLLALALAAPAASARQAPHDGFAIATAPYRFSFPADHASHPKYRTEWWYYTGHLRAADGRTFGYELTFFRIGLRPGDPPPKKGESRWRGHEIFPAHFAITDERDKRFFSSEVVAREALGMGHASTHRLDVRAGGWWLRGAPMADPRFERMTMHAAASGNGIDLTQTPQKPPAIHGHGGVSRKGSCASCASHYYSYTRLATTGTLRYGGRAYRVTGLSWMDHEYGSDQLQADQVGWDWFSIQLADRRELMLYRLRRRDGTVVPASSGSLIEPDGSVRYLSLAQMRVDVLGTWRSPHTGGDYPSGWRVRVPVAGIDVTLEPTVRDQELVTTGTGVAYWEGAVGVRRTGGASIGAGYVELTGYAGKVTL